MRANRRDLHIGNIVEACLNNPEFVFETIQDIIDAPENDIPDEGPSPENIRLTIRLQSYYGNQQGFLVNLYGVLRYAATNKHPQLMAMRDYLEKAASACAKKYEASSRVLTGYQELRKDPGARTI